MGETLAIHNNDFVVGSSVAISLRPVKVVSASYDDVDKSWKYTLSYSLPWMETERQTSGVLESVLFRPKEIMGPDDGTTLSRVIDEALNTDETEEAAKAAKLNLNSRQKLGRIHKLLVALEAQSQRNTEVLDAHSKLLAKLADPQEAARRSGAVLAKIREARGEF